MNQMNDWQNNENPIASPEQEGQPTDQLGLESGEVATGKSRIPRSVVFVGVVLAIAAGTLYVMRWSGSLSATSEDTSKAEQTIEKALVAIGAIQSTNVPKSAEDEDDTQALILRFADDPTKKQVGLDNLSKNPFEVMLNRSKKDGDEGQADSVMLDEERARRERLAKLRGEVGKYRLQSVLAGGGEPVAMVSGKVVQIGDKLGSFQVAAISPMAVTLVAGENTYQLKISQPAAP